MLLPSCWGGALTRRMPTLIKRKPRPWTRRRRATAEGSRCGTCVRGYMCGRGVLVWKGCACVDTCV